MNLEATVFISLLLFVVGLAIVILRKELLFILMGIEVMFNGAALVVITGAQHWHDPTGQVLTLMLMIIAGAELAVSLLIVMHCYRQRGISCIDQLNQLRD